MGIPRRAGCAVAATAVACLTVLASAQEASAALTCSVESGGTRLVVGGSGPGRPVLFRSGDSVIVREEQGAAQVPCAGPAATVTTLDAIEVSGDDDGATIDLSGGPFAPGASGETDAPEIEIAVNGLSEIIVIGSPGPDYFRSQSASKTESSAELNAGEDADPDLVLRSSLYQGSPIFLGGPGDDVIDFVTGGINGGFGGGGNDLISAAPRSLSFFAGGKGADRMVGGNGQDIMNAGPGRDLLIGGKGDDGLEAAGQGQDRIRCGPGKDLYGADRRDSRKSCETDFKTIELPKVPKPPGKLLREFAFDDRDQARADLVELLLLGRLDHHPQKRLRA